MRDYCIAVFFFVGTCWKHLDEMLLMRNTLFAWVKVYQIIPESRIFRQTFHRNKGEHFQD